MYLVIIYGCSTCWIIPRALCSELVRRSRPRYRVFRAAKRGDFTLQLQGILLYKSRQAVILFL